MLRNLFAGLWGRATIGRPGGSSDPGAPGDSETARRSEGSEESEGLEYSDQETWDGATTGESFPAITTPATFSFARRFYRAAYRDLARMRGMPHETLDAYDTVFGGILGYIRGKIYLRDRAWTTYEDALVGLPGSKQPEPHLDRYLPEYMQYVAQVRQAHLEGVGGLDLGDLVDLYHSLEGALFGRAGFTVATDLRVIAVFTDVTGAMVAAGIDPEGAAGGVLFAQDNLAGAAPTQNLSTRAARIRADAALSERFSGEPREVLNRLVEDAALVEIREGIECYLGAYGHRGPGEMLLERQMPADRPDLVVAQIQALVHGPRAAAAGAGAGTGAGAGVGAGAGAGAGAGSNRRAGPGARAGLGAALERKLAAAREWIAWRERMRACRAGIFDAARRILREIGGRLADLGVLETADDVWFLSVEETLDFCEGYGLQEDLAGLVAMRRQAFESWSVDPPPDALIADAPVCWPPSQVPGEVVGPGEQDTATVHVTTLRGVVAWPGRVEGIARVLRDPAGTASLGGDILVADRTDPGWTPLFPTASAIVVEHGNPLCHAAILARELRIPTMVGVAGLLAVVQDGDRIVVDANAGEIRILGRDPGRS